MKKSNLLLTTFSIFLFFQFNLKNEKILNNKLDTSSIIEEVSKQYENNDQLKLSYFSILTTISKTNFFDKINQKIPNIEVNAFKDYFLSYENNDFFNVTFFYKNANYSIKINNAVFNIDSFNKFEKIFIKNAIYNTEDSINKLLFLGIISELSYYYSQNNNFNKLLQTINLIKDFIFNLNNDSSINKSGKFLTEIKSWNLDKTINDYENKIYISKLNTFRSIKFDEVKFDSNISEDFNWAEFVLCNDFKSSWLMNGGGGKGQGNFTGYVNVSFKDKNNKEIFRVVQCENMNANLWWNWQIHYGEFTFSEINNVDIIN